MAVLQESPNKRYGSLNVWPFFFLVDIPKAGYNLPRAAVSSVTASQRLPSTASSVSFSPSKTVSPYCTLWNTFNILFL